MNGLSLHQSSFLEKAHQIQLQLCFRGSAPSKHPSLHLVQNAFILYILILFLRLFLLGLFFLKYIRHRWRYCLQYIYNLFLNHINIIILQVFLKLFKRRLLQNSVRMKKLFEFFNQLLLFLRSPLEFLSIFFV